jgi:hypothetical protein
VFFCLSCAISIYLVAVGAFAAEPSLIALVNVINTFSCIGEPNNFKPPDIILAAFQQLLKIQGPNKTPPKYSLMV